MNKSIVAVIVTYNRLNLLKESIKAVQYQTIKPSTVIVVNNNSTDGTYDWLKMQADLKVINQENVGGAGGFKRGIAEALTLQPDWIWIMDDDAIPYENCLEQLLIDASETGASVICPLKVGIDGQIQKYHYGTFDKIKGYKFFEDSFFLDKTCSKVDFCSFVGPLFSLEILEKVGLPRSDFFIWFDDMEYSLRIRRNTDIFMSKNAVICHKETVSTDLKKTFIGIRRVSYIDSYWKELHGFRNFLTVMYEYGSYGLFRQYLYLFKKIARIILIEDFKAIRIKWLLAFFKQFKTQTFVNINPSEWKKNINNKSM